MTENKIIFSGTVQLLGWSDTHTGGAKIVLALESSEDLESFKPLTIKHGKVAGQLLGIAVALQNAEPPELAPLENPVARVKGGPLARLAGMWCQRDDFQQWLCQAFTRIWAEHSVALAEPSMPELAKLTLYSVCNVDSLAKLDHDPAAQVVFHDLIREPFAALLRARGQD